MDKNIDLHCDLTAYLIEEGASIDGDIRCSLPNLLEGNVAMQVMAFYSGTEKGSVEYAKRQLQVYRDLISLPEFFEIKLSDIQLQQGKIGVIAAIENASGLCEEDMPIEKAFENFDFLNDNAQLMYVGLTHHLENRFGGGNFTEIGLKEDGKLLVEYLNSRKIAVDLSHTSDKLAYDILNLIDSKNLNIPIIASHSNMRAVFNHNRNLPDELVQEIVRRGGLIGLNLVKSFINPEDPDYIYRHIDHAVKLGAENHLCFGADFFDDKSHPDQSRYPFFFDEYGNSTAYSKINEKVTELFSEDFKNKVSHENVLSYFNRLYKN